jgi:hypothetical protein
MKKNISIKSRWKLMLIEEKFGFCKWVFNGGFLLSIFMEAVDSMEREGIMWLADEVARERRETEMVVKGG